MEIYLQHGNTKMKDKVKAFLTHLGICGVVAALAVYVVFFVWYPMPLHTAVGVTKIFLILLAVDVTIGPLITFIVYKKDKKSLKFDLTVVAFLQLAALCYGMNTVFVGRPAFVVFNVDRFTITRAHDINSASAEKAMKSANESAKISWLQPKWVGAVAAKDNKRRNEIMMSSAMGGADWPELPELFVPLANVKELMLKRAKPLSELRTLHEKETEILEKLANWQDDEVKWLPLSAPVKDGVVLIDAKTSAVLKSLDIKPWP